MTTICLSSIKGGTGKSSISIMLSKYLAKTGKRILCIDLDPQNSLTFHFLDDQQTIDNHNIALALQAGNLLNHIVPSNHEKVDIIPSSFSLVNLRAISEKALKKLLPQLKNIYDFLIIDTAPTWDNIVLNAIHASDYIISPARLAQFDHKGAMFFRDQLTMDTDKVYDWYILINFYKEPRTDNPENLTNQYLDLFSNDFPNILNMKIPETILVQKSIDTQEIISEAHGKKKLHDSISSLAKLFLDENATSYVRQF